jgi:hypothetical protein
VAHHADGQAKQHINVAVNQAKKLTMVVREHIRRGFRRGGVV